MIERENDREREEREKVYRRVQETIILIQEKAVYLRCVCVYGRPDTMEPPVYQVFNRRHFTSASAFGGFSKGEFSGFSSIRKSLL